MAPEVIEMVPHTLVSDYYSLGVIAWQLMNGYYNKPYDASKPGDYLIMMKKRQANIPKHQIPNGWSPQAAKFIN